MDEEEHDYHNFSTSPTHKLPTLNGTQALKLAVTNSKPHSTGLRSLDRLLCSSEADQHGGLRRGVVTELYGPPGVGKTTFALQVAINAIGRPDQETHVTWIDTASSLVTKRAMELTRKCSQFNGGGGASSTEQSRSSNDDILRQRFHHVRIKELSHLLALVLHPPFDFPPNGTDLIIFDDISNFLLSELSPNVRQNSTTSSGTNTQIRNEHAAKILATRRTNVISSFASGLQKLAAATNTTVIVINKTSTISKDGQKAVLRSALSSEQWMSQIHTRILLYRDAWPSIPDTEIKDGEAEKRTRKHRIPLRVAEVERMEGKEVNSEGVQFTISQDGLQAVNESAVNTFSLTIRTEPAGIEVEGKEEDITDLHLENEDEISFLSPHETEQLPDKSDETQKGLDAGSRVPKRKAFEIADSEDEHEADDEEIALPPMPQKLAGFLPSSQIAHNAEIAVNLNDVQQGTTTSDIAQNRKAAGNEDMLFDSFEDG